MRMVCSELHNHTDTIARPTKITRQIYEKALKDFYNKSEGYIELILEVLNKYYRDEYDMLLFLANNEIEQFTQFAHDTPSLTNHLKGYGIIEEYNGQYDFKIDIVKRYLQERNPRKHSHETADDARAEITNRRNKLEVQLKTIIKQLMRANYGEEVARQKVLKHISYSQKNPNIQFAEIFEPRKCDFYFDEIRKLVLAEWAIFEKTFENKKKFDLNMQLVNEFRIDAHPDEITPDEMVMVRSALSQLEHISGRFF